MKRKFMTNDGTCHITETRNLLGRAGSRGATNCRKEGGKGCSGFFLVIFLP